MRIKEIADQVLDLYPRIFHACHSRHVHDPRTRQAVSTHQARVLDHLDDFEPTSLMGLARHMGVSPSTMSLTVERLVRRGYVNRSRDAADGRVVSLRLTAAGARLRDAQSVLDPARLKAMVARLSPEERRQAVHGLGLLARAAVQEMHSRSSKDAGSRRQAGSARGAGSAGVPPAVIKTSRGDKSGRDARAPRNKSGRDARAPRRDVRASDNKSGRDVRAPGRDARASDNKSGRNVRASRRDVRAADNKSGRDARAPRRDVRAADNKSGRDARAPRKYGGRKK